MNKFYGVLITCILLISCDADSSIGTIDIRETNEKNFSVFVPEVGTFEFKQTSNTSTNVGNVKTYVRVTDGLNNQDDLNLEIFGFKSEIIKYENLSFVYRNILEKNNTQFKIIDSSSNVLLDKNKIHISVFENILDESTISGHYEGIARLADLDANGEETGFEIFNVYGNISKNNQLLLLNVDENSNYDHLEGIFDFDINDSINFSGLANKDNIPSATILNDSIRMSENGLMLKKYFKLNFESSNQQKDLDLTIQRTNQ